jgi:hypothetical protein
VVDHPGDEALVEFTLGVFVMHPARDHFRHQLIQQLMQRQLPVPCL